ncbi:30S ribosome-binding factor RbfA [bacterium]|nr:30S ribosome-binding factor RbfA [bacterium]
MPASERMHKINSLIKQEVGYILQHDIKDKRIGFVTVLRAEISRDLRNGKIYVSILDDSANKKAVINVLNQSAGYIQHLIGSRVRLRYLPKLRFYYDDVIEHSIHIQQILDEIKKKDEHKSD